MSRALLIGLIFSPVVLAQSTYVWTDEQGRKHYSDQPPPPAVKTEQRKFDARAPDSPPPYAVRRAAEGFPVVLHTGEGCTTLCEQARKLLAKRGIPYTESKIATKEEHARMTERFGGNGIVPAIEVGTNRFSGFTEEKWNAMLDEAGYPRSLAGLSR